MSYINLFNQLSIKEKIIFDWINNNIGEIKGIEEKIIEIDGTQWLTGELYTNNNPKILYINYRTVFYNNEGSSRQFGFLGLNGLYVRFMSVIHTGFGLFDDIFYFKKIYMIPLIPSPSTNIVFIGLKITLK